MFQYLFVIALAAPPWPVSPVMNRAKFAAGDALCTSASCKVLNAVAATASSGSRTFTVSTGGFSKTVFQLDYTYSAATDQRLACYGSLNGGASYARIMSTGIVSGSGTLMPYTDICNIGVNQCLTGSGNILIEYDSRNYDKMQCVWSATSGGAGDTVNIYAAAAVGQ